MKYGLQAFRDDSEVLAHLIRKENPEGSNVFGVPQGGIPLAMEISKILGWGLCESIPHLNKRSVVVDDVADSGTTRKKFGNRPFYVLHMKKGCDPEPTNQIHTVEKQDWIEYWWEGEGNSAADIVLRTLQYIGEDDRRPGLVDTPKRVLKSWDHIFGGYREDPKDHIKTFQGTEHTYDQMVLLRDIEIYSMCEHHILPFFGKAHVAYIPGNGNRVIGVSKLARILDTFARRLQIQERIGEQVTTFLMENLEPVGAACIIEADHLCMRMRGVEKQNSIMTTSSLKGIFLEDSDKGRAARGELMRLIR